MKHLFKYTSLVVFLSVTSSLNAAPTEPIRTQYADIGDDMEFKLGWQSFRGVEVDEVEDFEGWTAMAEFVYPFDDRFRLRLTLPFRTDGKATVKDNQPMQQGETIDVDGNGGVFDFLTLQFEHQLWFAENRGYNLSYYIEGGHRTQRLETTKRDLKQPQYFDPMNHTGMVLSGGIKFDRVHSFGQVLANLGVRYYFDTDDLHPRGTDSWPALDARLAVIFSPWGPVHPAVEVTYLGDFSDLNQLSVLPELLFNYKMLDLKLGAGIGLGGNGNELGAIVQAGLHF